MKDKRFVVQEHETADGVHWDLMLEQDDVLATFRLEEPPGQALLHSVRAERIFDHPLRFLWYEGPVQNGSGRVHIAERGTYRPTERRDDLLALRLDGTALTGAFTLIRTGEAEWRFESAGSEHDPCQSPR